MLLGRKNFQNFDWWTEDGRVDGLQTDFDFETCRNKSSIHRPWTTQANLNGEKRGTTFVWNTAPQQWKSTPISCPVDTSSMKLTGQFYSGKRGATFVEFCFTAMAIHTISGLIDTSSTDLTGKCVRREKEAQHLLNAASHQWQFHTKNRSRFQLDKYSPVPLTSACSTCQREKV